MPRSLFSRALAGAIATIAVLSLTAQERHPAHPKRPAAASAPILTAFHGPGLRGLHREPDEVRADARQELLVRFYRAAAAQQTRVTVYHAPRPPASRPVATPAWNTRQSAPAPVSSFQACVRNRESHSTYTITNAEGASGAYQFMQGTWNNWARASGHGEYVGVLPARVPPAVQDAVAAYAMARDRSPWACTAASGCRHPC